MEIVIQQTAEAATRIAAQIIARQLRSKPRSVLGLATGSTPLRLYRELVAMNLDWRGVTTFNLDEYVGLPSGHAQSYRQFMQEHLFRYVNIAPHTVHIPEGNAEDIPLSCADYERRIGEAGGIDLQVLGIGTDGHIGFNEPSSSLASRTRIKTLTPQTRRDNGRFFGSAEAVPKHVVTMGIGTIMEARQIVLLAFGESKSTAVAGAVEGALSASNPASILQMHPAARVCLDDAAASRLARADYYRWVFENKPDWQRP